MEVWEFSAQEARLIAGSFDNSLSAQLALWDLAAGERRRFLSTPAFCMLSLRLGRDAARLGALAALF